MTDTVAFTLAPYHTAVAAKATTGRSESAFVLGGGAARDGDILRIYYVLTGALPQLAIAPAVPTPERRHGLWEATCFEFFVAPHGSANYWEFNLSPAGHWNVFAFTDYRQGMRPETGITALPFQVQPSATQLRLDLTVDLGPLATGVPQWDLGVTTVMLRADGTTEYWAVAHTGPQPDFHRRDSFRIAL